MSPLNATCSVGALRADPVPAWQGVALDAGARSPASVPAGKGFTDADLLSSPLDFPTKPSLAPRSAGLRCAILHQLGRNSLATRAERAAL
jgi:hypothetical protein